MKLRGWLCAAAILGMSGQAAHADPPRSMFCVATRTTVRLDQNNYVSGAMGRVFVTRNFTTDLPDSAVFQAWRAFIVAKHPSTTGGIPDDSCYPDNARRSKISTFDDVKIVNVAWTPAEPGKAGGK